MVEKKLIKIRDFFPPLTDIMVLYPKIAGSGTPQMHRKGSNPDPCAPRQAMYKALSPDVITACLFVIKIKSPRIMVRRAHFILPVTTGPPLIADWAQDWPEPPGYGRNR